MRSQGKFALVSTVALCAAFAAPVLGQEFQYATPAEINDFPEEPEKLLEMQSLWSQMLASFVDIGRTGDPWTNIYDAPRSNFVDPKDPPSGPVFVQPITWTGFPNRVRWYFSTSQDNPYGLGEDLTYPLADEGRLDASSPQMGLWLNELGTDAKENLAEVLKKHPKLGSKDLSTFAPVKIPSEVCPVVDWSEAPEKWQLFTGSAAGPRAWKDEYNEWVVRRDDKGHIVEFSVTAESPEYWFTLWNVDPVRVLELYRDIVSPDVVLDDLYMRDAQGAVVMNYLGKPAYNPLNKWNYGFSATETGGGAAHLTSPPSTLGAEVYLGTAASILRDVDAENYGPNQMICSGQYGGHFRNSDPNIGLQGNQVIHNLKMRYTMTDPIALYMQYPDFSNYETPDGTPAETFLTVKRGRLAKDTGGKYDEILHMTFRVPESYGYTVSDIKINGRKIIWGSQISETYNVALAASVYLDSTPVDATRYPEVGDNPTPNAWAQQPMATAVFDAVQNVPAIADATVPILPVFVAPGTKLDAMAIEAIDGAADAKLEYVAPDGTVSDAVRVTVHGTNTLNEKPDSKGIYEEIFYLVSIEVDANATPGSYGLRIQNPGAPEQIATPGNLIVRAKQ